MSVFTKLFKSKKQKKLEGYFKMLDGYVPSFSSYDGGVYEMELTRACIHAFANHCSKLMPTVTGPDLQKIQAILDNKPNFMMTSAQFLYKAATIYEAQNTCFIVPILGEYDEIVGYYPVNPVYCEIVSASGEPFLKFTFGSGDAAAIEFEKVGVVSKFLYSKDIIGDDNKALNPTLQLIDLQNKGIEEGIKTGASFRFWAQLGNWATDEDLEAERKKFSERSLSSDKSGMLLFPNTYGNIHQVTSQPKLVDSEQMTIIQNRVYNYFGSNEAILQNKCVGDAWDAYYEGKIEPFAIQLSQAMTAMTYSPIQISRHNEIMWSSNRLQYMTAKDKNEMITAYFDRGLMTQNMVYDILNLPHVEGGDTFYIRKEYTQIENLNKGDDPVDTEK